MATNSDNYIQFLGAAGTVTGSKYLIAVDGFHILVDGGLFQGVKELRERNWKDLPFPVSKINVVILTHGHLDHTGYLPRLVQQGLKCPVYCTEPTADLVEIISTRPLSKTKRWAVVKILKPADASLSPAGADKETAT